MTLYSRVEIGSNLEILSRKGNELALSDPVLMSVRDNLTIC